MSAGKTGKNPGNPERPLAREPGDVIEIRPLLRRFIRTSGDHVLPWNQLRTYGPIPSMRGDHHPTPMADHRPVGVLYTGLDLATIAAEVYQSTRTVDVTSGDPQLLVWTPTRPLRLLDLTPLWALRNGASHSLNAAPRTTCRALAQAIHAAWPDLDGLRVESTMTGAQNVVLTERAADSFPDSPATIRELRHPSLLATLTVIADQIGYGIV